jgi:hypothetical protein
MDDHNDRQEFSREPTIDDLVELCRHLNEAGVKYVVVGGFAVILNGFTRTTGDVDLLVDSSPENVARIKKALLYLPDQAVREIDSNEVSKYSVVRVADEIIVDLMHKACDVTFGDSRDHTQFYKRSDVQIPFLKPELLLKTKMTLRAKDAEDRFFLEQLLEIQKNEARQITQSSTSIFNFPVKRFLRKFLGFFKK